MDLQEVGGDCGDWMELAQDRDRWRAFVMNLRGPKMRGISRLAAECILMVVRVFLTLSMYSYCYLCILIFPPCILIVAYVFLDAATLTEVFPCFFLGCKANARV